MNGTRQSYCVSYNGRYGQCVGELGSSTCFRIDVDGLTASLCYLPPLAMDLMRIGQAVYSVDRIARRDRVRSSARRRCVDLTIQVTKPAFWRQKKVVNLLQDILSLLAEDDWRVDFEASPPIETQACLRLASAPRICLYSGGLDSAAGLASRLRSYKGPMLAVTAKHQARQGPLVKEQLAKLRDRYQADIQSVMIRTTLINRPRLSKQESSQRCRSFLFASLGGAIACDAGADVIEMYESGVGAVNLPLMHGMLVGARTTKSSHPRFLRLMSNLVSMVADRGVKFELPFLSNTKAEVVRTLAEDGLADLACQTASCVRYPLRNQGKAKQCGYCAACIGRRQALITAGVDEPSEHYEVDLFSQQANEIPPSRLDYLAAILMQVEHIKNISHSRLFQCHVRGTQVIEAAESEQPLVNLLLRYRQEWIELSAKARAEGLRWARWIGGEVAA